MSKIDNVIQTILDESEKMTTLHQFLKLVELEGYDAIVKEVQTMTGAEFYSTYTELEYIVHFLKELTVEAIECDEFKQAKSYINVLNNLS